MCREFYIQAKVQTRLWAGRENVISRLGSFFRPWLPLAMLLAIFCQAAPAQTVLISEFAAINSGAIRDQDGDSSDWIELFNSGDAAVGLEGWFLTDDSGELAKWRFPSVELRPGQFLLVFASGKNRSNPTNQLHTNFKLNAAGEYLALVRPDGTVNHRFGARYPNQLTGLSYGIAMAGQQVESLAGGYLAPSPGTTNGSFISFGPTLSNLGHSPLRPGAGESVAVRTRIRSDGHPIQTVTLFYRIMFGPTNSLPMLDDGTQGDGAADDGIYGAVIPGGSAGPGEMIRWFVRAIDAGGQESRLPEARDPTASPEFLGVVVADPQVITPLPVVNLFIQPSDLALATTPVRVACAIEYLGEFYDNIRLDRHGGNSAVFSKKSYNVDFNRDQPFRWSDEAPRIDEVYLISTSTDKAHLRSVLAYEHTFKPAGVPYHWTVPVRVQTNGGFFGIWHLMEGADENYLERNGRSRRGALYRLHNPFSSLEHATILPGLSSTRAEKKTRREEGNADLVELFNGVVAQAPGPDRVKYLHDHVDIAQMLNALAARAVTSDLACCTDNYYLYRDSEGTGEWQTFPWDVDLTFGRSWSPTYGTWDSTLSASNRVWGGWDANAFFQALLNSPLGQGDGGARQMYLRRVRTLMDELQQRPEVHPGLLRYENVLDDLSRRLAPDAALDLAKWGSFGGGTSSILNPNSSYYQSLPQAIADLKTNYFANRRRFVFDRLMDLPGEFPLAQPPDIGLLFGELEFQPASGNQDEEYIQLINTNTIAVDISGWRLSGGIDYTFQEGVVIPAGSLPTNALYVARNKRAFRARAVDPHGGQGLRVEGGFQRQLSARGETVVLSDKSGRVVTSITYPGHPTPAQNYLRVSEINFSPGFGPASERYPAGEFAFIEFVNLGPVSMDLSHVRLAGSVQFDFGQGNLHVIDPGQRIVVVQNQAAFALRYGTEIPVAGQYSGGFGADGGQVQLEESGENVLAFDFLAQWQPMAAGPGFTLVVRREDGDFASWAFPETWRCSGTELGTPGQPDPGPLPEPSRTAVVNEVFPSPISPDDAFIEIYNSASTTLDISHWYLTDDPRRPRKYQFPAGTVLAPLGYVAVQGREFSRAGRPGSLVPFAFSRFGGGVYLISGDASGRLTGHLHRFDFGPADATTSFGRYLDSQMTERYVRLPTPSEVRPNPSPGIGPVAISEIHYHPIRLPNGPSRADEFVELVNLMDRPAPLHDPAHPTNTWLIAGRIQFQFPPSFTLGAGERVIVVGFDPDNVGRLDAFRNLYHLTAEVRMVGPWVGRLDEGDSVRLLAPLAPVDGQMPFAVVDGVNFDVSSPWPSAPNGSGSSLQRLDENRFGNDPTNWFGAMPTPGQSRASRLEPPVILEQSGDALLVAGQVAALRVRVDANAPVVYQWRRNGENIVGANQAVLSFDPVTLRDEGLYTCAIATSAGSVVTTPIGVDVVVPPVVTSAPAEVSLLVKPDRRAAPSTNATFQVTAVTAHPPLRYQWRFNGTNIPGATNREFTVVNVTTNHLGQLTCEVSDQHAQIVSSSAWLYPMITPGLSALPLSQSVVAGQLVTLSCSVTGFPPPFTFEWRRATVVQTNHVTDSGFDAFTFQADAAAGTTMSYRVVVKNRVVPLGLASPIASIFVLADSDSDGLSDQFELANDLDPANPADANLDRDGDGLTNGEEYLAGTDPRDSASFLRIDGPGWSGDGMVTVSFLAISNRTYAVESRDSLSQAAWRSVGQVTAMPTNRWVTVPDLTPTNVAGVQPRVYRLVTPVGERAR